MRAPVFAIFAAIGLAAHPALAQNDGAAPSLVLAFVSPDQASDYREVPREVARAFPGALL